MLESSAALFKRIHEHLLFFQSFYPYHVIRQFSNERLCTGFAYGLSQATSLHDMKQMIEDLTSFSYRITLILWMPDNMILEGSCKSDGMRDICSSVHDEEQSRTVIAIVLQR